MLVGIFENDFKVLKGLVRLIYFHMVDVFFVRCGPLGNCIARSLTPIYMLEFLLFMRAFLRLVVRATFHSR